MSKKTILVVEDEEDILELVTYNLTREGYKVVPKKTGEAGLDAARKLKPDLVVLDLMLPGLDGLEVCRLMKRDPSTERVPIVMFTARGEEADVVAGLELGADDYITKPFSPRVMVARLKAVLRRKAQSDSQDRDILRIRNIVIDPLRHEVLVDGDPVHLTLSEFRVLQCLARRPGMVFSRYQIVDAVHGEGYAVTDRSVDVQIVGLRKKLGSAAKHVETVRGIGYRFKE